MLYMDFQQDLSKQSKDRSVRENSVKLINKVDI